MIDIEAVKTFYLKMELNKGALSRFKIVLEDPLTKFSSNHVFLNVSETCANDHLVDTYVPIVMASFIKNGTATNEVILITTQPKKIYNRA